jgi:hypothetical protein
MIPEVMHLELTWSSWTAVVRGAVMHGVEKADKTLKKMDFCPKSWGLMVTQEYTSSRHGREYKTFTDSTTNKRLADGKMIWLIKKGDLVLSDDPKVGTHRFTWSFKAHDTRTFHLPIYEYNKDDLPSKYANSASGELRS